MEQESLAKRRIAGGLIFLAVLLIGVFLSTKVGCDLTRVKEPPNEIGSDPRSERCPQIPNKGPFAKAAIEGINLDKANSKLNLANVSKTERGMITVDHAQIKNGKITIHYDFGVIALGQERKKIFRIRNDGEGPLEVRKYKSTCQCTVAGVDAKGLKKGESTEIELKWEAKDERENFSQTAEICTNDPKRSTIAFFVTGQIVRSVELTPGSTWIVSQPVEQGSPSILEGRISSRVHTGFKIKRVEYANDELKVSVTTPTKEELKQEQETVKAKVMFYKIKAEVLANSKVGKFELPVTIKTDIGGGSDFKFRVVGSRTGPIKIRPLGNVRWLSQRMQIDLNDVPTTKPTSVSLLLFVAGLKDADLKITSYKSDPQFLQVKLVPYALPGLKKSPKSKTGRRAYQLTFTVPSVPANKPLKVRERNNPGTVEIETNHPHAKKMTFSLLFNQRRDQ